MSLRSSKDQPLWQAITISHSSGEEQRLFGGHYTAEKWQRTVVPTTADERRESTMGYKPLCISTPGDCHCSYEISRLQVLSTLQHGTDDDDDDEMQLAAQTAQQLESRRRAEA